MVLGRAVIAAAACALTAVAGAAFEAAGPARVIDGDTLEVAGERHRLHGIDAPEKAQTCLTPGSGRWCCGVAAAEALARRIGGRPVICRSRTRDRYHRRISVCFVGGVDLNAWMVRNGWALAYRAYSHDYVAGENAAKAQRLGLWSGRFMAPWAWRRGQRLAAPPPPPVGQPTEETNLRAGCR